jgi:hypothetical protein
VLAAGLIAYAAIAAFPGLFMAMAPGPDPSWVYALNVLPATGYTFGSDLAFTYGPLARFILPTVPPSTLVPSAIGWFLFALLLGAGLTYHYLRTRRLTGLATAVAAMLLGLAFGVPYEYQLLIVLGLILAVPPEDRRAWTPAAALGACLAAALFYFKTTSGLAAGAMLLAAGGWWIARREARASAVAVRLVVPYAVTFVALGLLLVGPPADVAGWIRRSFQIASGFGDAMTVEGTGTVKVLALLALAVFAAFAAIGTRRGSRDLFVAILFSGPLFLAFRASFVRHHGRYLIPFLLSIGAIALLLAETRRRLLRVGIALALILPLAVGATFVDECLCRFHPALLGTRGWQSLSYVLELDDVRAHLAHESEVELRIERLPPEWVTRIQEAGDVGVIPWEISLAAANDLDWRPTPVIQTYHAYTDGLDQAVADDLTTDGPPYLLLQFIEFDGRYPLWSAPEMWASIFSHYELVDTLGPAPGREPVALMARRENPIDLGLTREASTEARVGEWIDIPDEPGLVFTSIDMDRDIGGTLASFFWNIDPVLMDLRFEDGRVWAARFLPGTAGGRHLASYPPLLFDQLAAFLRGVMPPRAVAFRIYGPGAGSFRPDLRVMWWSSTWTPPGPQEAFR